ncbi:hypothetical protein NQ317_011906 [Molorchus minor]|uniref:Tyr recombinase domain-containing protein n=1 Tax=Molorchus minor TaxID=1323400 RepID=A0ABQ9IQ20_9CUCU|nr:hypothetical protein NQ317_011906 [Molorchus minor]
MEMLKAPELNAEINSAITTKVQRTDKYVQNNQNHLGTGLSAIGRTLSALLNNNDWGDKEFHQEILTKLSDAGKILCNVYHNMSICRRSLIIPLLNVKVKEITASASSNKLLFGDNLSEPVEAEGGATTSMASTPRQRIKDTQSKELLAKTEEEPLKENPSVMRDSYPGGCEIVRQSFLNKKVPIESVSTILESLSPNTRKQYYSVYKHWWEFCKTKKLDPLLAGVNEIISFLQHKLNTSTYKYGTFNNIRSALALILPGDVGKNPIVTRFIKAISRLRPQRPRYNITWDPQQVLTYLSSEKYNRNLDIKNLSKKTITLLALATGHRLQTFSLIRTDHRRRDKYICPRFYKDVRPRKGTTLLTFTLFEDSNLCVATTIIKYIEETSVIRPADQEFLFITLRPPYRRATTQTLAGWIKEILGKSGVNTTVFSAYSTRHAATSAAFGSGVPIESIRKSAGWTKNSKVFYQYYNRPLLSTNSETFVRNILTK